jgi:hypothetical protein
MSISQIDMVVWRDEELQVCGNLERDGTAPSSDEVQAFLAVVRQGDKVAALHAAQPFDPEKFQWANGRWELKGTPSSEVDLEANQHAVVSVVAVLKSDNGELSEKGVETLSWVQPVTIVPERQDADPKQQVAFTTKPIASLSDSELEVGHSVSASLTILHRDGAGGGTFHSLQQVDGVKPAPPTP